MSLATRFRVTAWFEGVVAASFTVSGPTLMRTVAGVVAVAPLLSLTRYCRVARPVKFSTGVKVTTPALSTV